MNRWLALLVGFLTLLASSSAQASTIDFGTTNDASFAAPDTYAEDGFTFEAISGSQWAIVGALPFGPAPVGNPASGLAAGVGAAPANGDTIAVTRVGGGLFTFDAFDYAMWSELFAPSVGVNFIGRVGGVQTESLLNITATSESFVTGNPSFASPIDELLIVAASTVTPHTTLELDNFVLTPVGDAVPEPASLTLLGLGLAAVGARRWRQRKQ